MADNLKDERLPLYNNNLKDVDTKHEGLPLYNALYAISEGIPTSYGLRTSGTECQLTVRKIDGAHKIMFRYGAVTISKTAFQDANHHKFEDYLDELRKMIESDSTIDDERRKSAVFAFSLLTLDPNFQTRFYSEPMITREEHMAIQGEKIAEIKHNADIAMIEHARKEGTITNERADQMIANRRNHM